MPAPGLFPSLLQSLVPLERMRQAAMVGSPFPYSHSIRATPGLVICFEEKLRSECVARHMDLHEKRIRVSHQLGHSHH